MANVRPTSPETPPEELKTGIRARVEQIIFTIFNRQNMIWKDKSLAM